MFARLKDAGPNKNGGRRSYVQVVRNVRDQGAGCHDRVIQRVIATLGRVDHLGEHEQADVVARVSAALEGIRPTRRRRVPSTPERFGMQAHGIM